MIVVALVMEALLRGALSELNPGSSGAGSEELLVLLPQATSDNNAAKRNKIGIGIRPPQSLYATDSKARYLGFLILIRIFQLNLRWPVWG